MRSVVNKRGDLMNNVLTTIIAVVGLALILFAAYKLYSAYVNQEERNAQALINKIESKINALPEEGFIIYRYKNGGSVFLNDVLQDFFKGNIPPLDASASEVQKFSGYVGAVSSSPPPYLNDSYKRSIVLAGFDGGANWFLYSWWSDSSNRPDQCYFKSCICICRGSYETPKESCQTKGFCRLFDKGIGLVHYAPSGMISVLTEKELPSEMDDGKATEYPRIVYAPIPSNMFELKAAKAKDGAVYLFAY